MQPPRTTVLRLALGAIAAFAVPAAAFAQETETPTIAPAEDDVVRSIVVEGNERYTDEQLIAALGIKVGEVLDAETVDRVGVRVLFDRFFVRAVVYKSERPAAEGGGVDVRVVVTELPVDLEPRFVGNVEVDDEDLYEWAGLSERSELYVFQAPRIRERLLRSYREEGFYFVEIDVVDRPGGVDPDTGEEVPADVVFDIKEGPEVKVEKIVITGNETLPDERILFFKTGLSSLAEVDLRKPWLFGLFPKDFVRETLDADIIAMREVYRDYGFLDAVVELDHLEFSEDREWVTIHVAIDEGGRYTVGSVSLEGIEIFQTAPDAPFQQRPAELQYPVEDLLPLLETKVGDVYERRHYADDRRALRKYYGERGHIDHRSLRASERWILSDPLLTFEKDAPIVHVTYQIAEGREIFLREILVAGNVHTQDRVVRDLITLDPGGIADPEQIERSLSRITASGFFSDPRGLSHIDPTYRYLDTPDASWKDLEFRVDEGQILTFNIAGGVSSNTGAFGAIGLAMKNFDIGRPPGSFWDVGEEIATRRAFHGAGQTLSLDLRPGTEFSSYTVRFSDPDIFRRHRDRISLSVTAQERIRRYRTHDEERDRFGFTVGRSFTVDTSLFTGYEIGSVFVDDIDTSGETSFANPFTVPRELKEQEGETDLAHVILGFSYEEIDNALNTRNGLSFVFRNEWYDRAFGSDVDFVRSTMTFDWWNEFDDDPYVVSPYCHLQLGIGVATPYGSDGDVPYTEQFHLGGLSTLRGYRFRGVGPHENGEASGGQTQLYGTLEYRFPLVKQVQPGTYREYESLQAGAFIDFGVLDEYDFALKVDDVRVTAGFLFGVSIPIPITFSFGWPLRDVDDEDDERVFGFNIGF